MEQYEINDQPKQGSILKGFVGALLGALLGGILWGLIGFLTQQVFVIAGFGLGFLVAGGYNLFKGRKGVPMIIIVVLCVILSVVLGEALYNFGMLEQEYKRMPEYVREALAEEGFNVETMADATLQMFYDMSIPTKEEFYRECLMDATWQADAFKNLGQALLFALLGAAGVIFSMSKKDEAQQSSGAVAADDGLRPEFHRLDDKTEDHSDSN